MRQKGSLSSLKGMFSWSELFLTHVLFCVCLCSVSLFLSVCMTHIVDVCKCTYICVCSCLHRMEKGVISWSELFFTRMTVFDASLDLRYCLWLAALFALILLIPPTWHTSLPRCLLTYSPPLPPKHKLPPVSTSRSPPFIVSPPQYPSASPCTALYLVPATCHNNPSDSKLWHCDKDKCIWTMSSS